MKIDMEVLSLEGNGKRRLKMSVFSSTGIRSEPKWAQSHK